MNSINYLPVNVWGKNRTFFWSFFAKANIRKFYLTLKGVQGMRIIESIILDRQ